MVMLNKTISLLNRTQPDMAEAVRALVRERDDLKAEVKGWIRAGEIYERINVGLENGNKNLKAENTALKKRIKELENENT